MKKRKFVAEVLALRPDFLNVDTFFYHSQYDHVLTGFGCEVMPGRLYLARFTYPLFFRFSNGLTLTYNHRLPGDDGVINTTAKDEANLAFEFVSKMERLAVIPQRSLSLSEFCKYVASQSVLSSVSHVQMVLGCAHLLDDQLEKASMWLNASLQNPIQNIDGENFMLRGKLADLLIADPESAKRHLLLNEHDMKKILKIC